MPAWSNWVPPVPTVPPSPAACPVACWWLWLWHFCSPAEAAFPPNFSSSPAAAPRPWNVWPWFCWRMPGWKPTTRRSRWLRCWSWGWSRRGCTTTNRHGSWFWRFCGWQRRHNGPNVSLHGAVKRIRKVRPVLFLLMLVGNFLWRVLVGILILIKWCQWDWDFQEMGGKTTDLTWAV